VLACASLYDPCTHYRRCQIVKVPWPLVSVVVACMTTYVKLASSIRWWTDLRIHSGTVPSGNYRESCTVD